MMWHDMTGHDITLHYIPFHYMTWHDITLHLKKINVTSIFKYCIFAWNASCFTISQCGWHACLKLYTNKCAIFFWRTSLKFTCQMKIQIQTSSYVTMWHSHLNLRICLDPARQFCSKNWLLLPGRSRLNDTVAMWLGDPSMNLYVACWNALLLAQVPKWAGDAIFLNTVKLGFKICWRLINHHPGKMVQQC